MQGMRKMFRKNKLPIMDTREIERRILDVSEGGSKCGFKCGNANQSSLSKTRYDLINVVIALNVSKNYLLYWKLRRSAAPFIKFSPYLSVRPRTRKEQMASES